MYLLLKHINKTMLEKVHFLVDVSFSMQTLIETVCESITSTIEPLSNDTLISLSTFSDNVNLDTNEVSKLMFYTPNLSIFGLTALYDSIVEIISHEMDNNSTGKETKHVTVVIITDGINTHGTKTCTDANQCICQAKDRNISIKFLGANQDAIATAASLGLDEGDALTFSAKSFHVAEAFRSLSEVMVRRIQTGEEQHFSLPQRVASVETEFLDAVPISRRDNGDISPPPIRRSNTIVQ